LRQHAWPAWNLAFADNGRHLLSAGLDGMLLLWDLQPDQPRLAWAQAHQFPARAVAWDEPGRQIYFTCKQPAGANQDAFSLQLRKIAWVNILPDPAEAEKIIARRAGLHIPSPDAVCLVTPDGKTMVTTSPSRKPGSKAQVIRLWDAASGRSRFAVPARKGIALSPDGKWLVFVRPGPRPQIGLIEVRANLVHADRAPLETDTLPPVLFTPDGQSMWVLLKNELVLYQLPALTPGRRLQLQAPADDSTLNLIPAQDGQTFLVDRNSPRTGMRQRTLHALADGKELPWPNLPRDGEPPPFLRLRHKSEKIELEDIVQGTRVTIGRQRHVPQASALHPGRKLAVTVDATDDRGLLIHFWNFEERRLLLTLPDLASGAAGLRFSADGNLFCCITSAGWTRIVPTDWLLERKALLSSLPATAPGPE
jgi:WD40 repeat protein